jgi:hypothetical protein
VKVFARTLFIWAIASFVGSRTAATPNAAGGVRGAEACVLRSEALGGLKVHQDLLAVAGQFHSEHSGGFDAYRSDAPERGDGGGVVFPWFDVDELESPVIPPRGVRIVSSLRSGYFVTRRLSGQCCREELGFWKRGQTKARWLGVRLYPDSAIETGAGEIWAITRGQLEAGQPPVRLLHVGSGGKVADTRLDVSAWAETQSSR